MRTPKIENKYNLNMEYNPNVKSVYNLQVADRSKIGGSPFWRNEPLHAWCISGSAGTAKDREFSTDTLYWIGIFDENAPFFTGRFMFHLDCFGGMYNYNPTGFYVPEEIENENDLLIQEMFLEKLNWLLDTGILKMGDE